LFSADLRHFQDVESIDSFLYIQRHLAREERENEPVEDLDPRLEEAEEFARSLILLVLGRREEIDSRLASATHNWSVNRMGSVERNIIRLAASEIISGETSLAVVVNEAVELAKRFGDQDSGAFVNGVADHLAKTYLADTSVSAASLVNTRDTLEDQPVIPE
jgi:N utilization substance protein B